MFGISKKEKEYAVYAPMSGEIINIQDVPDEAFAEKMLGDGVAILPESGEVVSPVSGVIEDITDTKHAFCIRTDDQTEILLHIGINTVNLKGKGFEVLVSSGDHVSVGDKLAQVDLALLEQHGLPLYTPILLTETDKYTIHKVDNKQVDAGKNVLFTYQRI